MKIPKNKSVILDYFLLIMLLSGAVLDISWATYIDEVIIGIFLFVILLKFPLVLNGRKNLNIIIASYITYSILLCAFQQLPLTSYLQIVITSKFIIIFYYFLIKNTQYKLTFFKYLTGFLYFLFFTSLIISMAQYLMPDLFELSRDGRGINGITLQGIFSSRTLFSSFLVIFIIFLSTANKEWNIFQKHRLIQHKNKFIILSLILLLLTFTRKDLVFAIGSLVFTLSTSKSKYRGILRMIALLLIIASPFISKSFFGKINEKSFSEDQVRLVILTSGLKVFDNYFPFGSGPGTFGSIMSIKYETVYEKMNIPERIYEGYNEQKRGPIFDVFVVSILAEYGIGIIFFPFILVNIMKQPAVPEMVDDLNINKFKTYSMIYVFLAALTVPILNNFIGLLLFAIFGILSNLKKI